MGLDMWLYEKEVHEVAYWRKDNAIHGWFIRNYANSVDDCSPVNIPREGIIELRNLCLTVLEANNEELAFELLPPTPGFFFGSYEIDQWYWEGIKETADKLTQIINESVEDAVFEYQASW